MAHRSAVAALLLALAARIASAGNAPLAREPTRIPPEPLGSAIRSLADARGFQVVFASERVEGLRTPGAAGNLTVHEALTQVLRGTGLTFYRMSGDGIVIEPIPSPAGSRPHRRGRATAAKSAPAPSSVGSPRPARGRVDPVTIEASAERAALRRKAHEFVAAVLARPRNRPLYRWDIPDRWNVPICPLVAGLPKAAGELVLESLSELGTYAGAATYAHVLLAGKACHPNLYVVATDHPDRLLENWWARDPLMYVTQFGIPPVRRFIHARRPIRVWYNTGLWCAGGAPVGWGNFPRALEASGPLDFDLPVCMIKGHRGALAQPTYGRPWSNITSAIVVIDRRGIEGITARQVADYVALIGLAHVRLDAETGSAPSILALFGRGTPPPGLTRWDRALVYSLYDTSRRIALQMPAIEMDMVRLLRQSRATRAAGRWSQ